MYISEPRKVAIVGANRIPFARSNTAYADLSNQTLLTDTLKGLVGKYKLEGERLGEVVGGAVLKHFYDMNLVRESVLSSGLDPNTPAFDIQQACGTGLEATILVANKIALGQIDVGIACGSDTNSDAPISINNEFRKGLLKLSSAKTNGDRLKAIAKLGDPRNLKPKFPALAELRTGKVMGEHAQITANELGVTRDEMDELTLASHKNLNRAYEEGFFDDLVMPYQGLKKDNNLRGSITIEQLKKLPPIYGEQETITAGSASALTDGASAVLLASEEWAKSKGLPILAYITAGEVAAVDYEHGKEGLLMAPTYAVPRMLKRHGLNLQDFDFYEIHEAFAAVPLSTMKAWASAEFCKERLGLDKPLGNIDRSKLNVKGSSLATGHPFAATGGRIVGSLAKTLSEHGKGRGLISICAAAGQGVVAIIEK